MKDTRFGENNNVERLQLLFMQLVMGMPDGERTIETFKRFAAEKGEEWARTLLSVMRDGYSTVLEDGEGKEYTVIFRMDLEGDLTFHAASPEEALDRFRKVDPRRLPIECGFDDCVTVDGIVDEEGRELAIGKMETKTTEDNQ